MPRIGQWTRRDCLRIGLGLAAGAVLAAAGCQEAPAPADKSAGAPAAQKAATTGGKVTLQWWSHTFKAWNDELTRQKNAYEAQLPSVEINYTVVPTDIQTKYTTAMQAGTGPDIIGAYSGHAPNFVAAGWQAELPKEYIEDIKSRFFPVCLDGATFRGKVYGYNQHIGGALPIANVTVFEEAKAKFPETWQDLVDLTKVIDRKEGGKLVRAAANFTAASTWLMITWGTMLRAYGGNYISEDLKSPAFNNELGKQITNMWLLFAHPEMGNLLDAFGQNRSGIYVIGPWQRSSFQNNYPNLKYKPLPALKGPKAQLQLDYVWNWMVSAKTTDEKKAASWQFCQWLNSTENQVSMVKASSLIPTTKAALDHPDVQKDEWVRVHVEQLANKQQYVPKLSNFVQIEKAYYDEFALLATGSQSVDDTLKKVEAEVAKLLKESENWT